MIFVAWTPPSIELSFRTSARATSPTMAASADACCANTEGRGKATLRPDSLVYNDFGNLDTEGCIMTVTINLPPEKEAAFKAEARARGLSIEQWMLELADQSVQPASIANLQRTNPQEWARQFRAWADSHDPKIPVLSDQAMSRESIYPDLM